MDHSQEDRRQQAMARYLAGDNIEVICRDLHCAKSWLYTWKARYQADNPAWVTSRSTQPQRKPSQTPQSVVERILTLRRTLGHQGKQGKAAAIHQELTQQGIEPIPSRRTIYRIIQRHDQENRYRPLRLACGQDLVVLLKRPREPGVQEIIGHNLNPRRALS